MQLGCSAEVRYWVTVIAGRAVTVAVREWGAEGDIVT